MSMIDDLAALATWLSPGGIVVLGEMHGTVEVPALAARIVRTAAAHGAVVLGLEIPDDLQPAIDAFVTATDHATARAALLGTPHMFWGWQDGRSSDAMIALVADVRALRAAGRDASVICFDGGFATAEDRDAGMARSVIAARAARPDAAIVVLCGNLHARTSSLRWMGGHLRASCAPLLSLNVVDAGGSCWAIRGEHEPPGILELRGSRSHHDGPLVTLFAARDEHGYDGELFAGTLTASPPAR
jgi:erythromycin esterase-like protein